MGVLLLILNIAVYLSWAGLLYTLFTSSKRIIKTKEVSAKSIKWHGLVNRFVNETDLILDHGKKLEYISWLLGIIGGPIEEAAKKYDNREFYILEAKKYLPPDSPIVLESVGEDRDNKINSILEKKSWLKIKLKILRG